MEIIAGLILVSVLVIALIVTNIVNARNTRLQEEQHQRTLENYEERIYLKEEQIADIREREETTIKKFMNRIFVQDAHSGRLQNEMLYLLLESKGVALPIKPTIKLGQDYMEEVKSHIEISKSEEAMRKAYRNDTVEE